MANKVARTVTQRDKEKFAAHLIRKQPRFADNSSVQKYLPPLSRNDAQILSDRFPL
jgi:hypothetical protein